MKRLVTIATYENPKSAYVLKEVLEEVHIACYFTFFQDVLKTTGEVRVQVDEEDVQQAIRIMMQVREEYGEIEQMEPSSAKRKILVPVDFSAVSEHASRFAVNLARMLDADVKILHVYENPVAGVRSRDTASFVDYAELTMEETEKNARSGMVTFTDRVRKYMKDHELTAVRIHASMVMGFVDESVNRIADIYRPDLIVLGISDDRGQEEGFISALSDSIIKAAEFPVYAVSGPFPPAGFGKLNILYATDFNEKDHSSLDKLLHILEPFEKSITCVHVDTDQNPANRERMDELNSFLESEYREHDIRCRLVDDRDVLHGIMEFAELNRINLLSFTTKKRSIFEKLFRPNLFRRVVHQSELPLLIFHS